MNDKQKMLLMDLLRTMYSGKIYETRDAGREVICVSNGSSDATFPERYFYIEDGHIEDYDYSL